MYLLPAAPGRGFARRDSNWWDWGGVPFFGEPDWEGLKGELYDLRNRLSEVRNAAIDRYAQFDAEQAQLERARDAELADIDDDIALAGDADRATLYALRREAESRWKREIEASVEARIAYAEDVQARMARIETRIAEIERLFAEVGVAL